MHPNTCAHVFINLVITREEAYLIQREGGDLYPLRSSTGDPSETGDESFIAILQN